MKPEWKKKWIKALTSGKYKQTRGRLRSDRDGYCCLGVLCDIVDPSAWKRKRADEGDTDAPTRWRWDQMDANLPSKVRAMVDISSTSEVQHLIELNDNSKANFTKIAAWIKDNL